MILTTTHLSIAEPAPFEELFLKPVGAPWTYLGLVVATVVAPAVERVSDAFRRPARRAKTPAAPLRKAS